MGEKPLLLWSRDKHLNPVVHALLKSQPEPCGLGDLGRDAVNIRWCNWGGGGGAVFHRDKRYSV